MKKKLVIIITTVLIVILALLVLWKLEVFKINDSSEAVKEENVEEDVLSILLNLQYPQLGDNIEEAQSLYGEPTSEADGQKAFQLSGKAENEIALYYDQADAITSLKFNVAGDKEKIHSLAEKLLPSGFTLVKGNGEEADNQNSYYYRLADGFAEILINKANDSSAGNNTDYTIEVTYLTETEFNSATNQEEKEAEEEKTTQGNPETQEDNESQEAITTPKPTESDSEEVKETEPSPTKNTGEFDAASAQINNQKVKDPDFLANAKKGIVQEIDVALKSTVGAMMESHGQPDWVVAVEGGYQLMYKNYHIGFGTPHEYVQDPKTPISSYYLPINLSEKEVIQSLGEPIAKEYSEQDGSYLLYYDLGNYKLYFYKNTDDPAETYKSVKLIASLAA
ncbi:hypothetical protein [Niallia taxi]|uniref:Uncharacterized protein n=1 Tax=Niallia taxi TaxID=2499688 RepID=A0A3S2W2L5_9BACI|nr:hypothetical protein [Niallia taxi]RVT59834.1 hypothetical protein EM808_18110 [Niallia taxi]